MDLTFKKIKVMDCVDFIFFVNITNEDMLRLNTK